MDEYKSVKKHFQKRKQEPEVPWWRPVLFSFLNKFFISALMLVATLIAVKVSPDLKEQVHTSLYSHSLSFAQINQWYEKQFGGVNPFDFLGKAKTEPVFQEKLVYQKQEAFQDGVKLTVGESYLVPVLESGIVVFIGDKDGYGKTIIVQQVNGVDLWYVNVQADSVKLYDYVEKGKLLGESKSDEIYLVFQKAGKFLNYKDYIS